MIFSTHTFCVGEKVRTTEDPGFTGTVVQVSEDGLIEVEREDGARFWRSAKKNWVMKVRA